MLSDFQQAQAEITASAKWCLAIRQDPSLVEERYQLTPRERRQLLAMAHHPGMDCGCTLYRANRIGPLWDNLPRTLTALGERLEATLTAYWEDHPWPYRYGYLESDRFCRWLALHAHLLEDMAEALLPITTQEREQIRTLLRSFLLDAAHPGHPA